MTARRAAAALATALALSGCAAALPPEAAETRTVVSATATVLDIDPGAGTLSLRDAATGQDFTVAAGAGAAELRRLAPGDVIMLDYFAATALEMAPEGADDDPLAVSGDAPAAIGERPGGVSVGAESVVVDFLGYDAARGEATIRGADGRARRLAVPGPLATFAAALTPGDRIRVTLTEAVAVSVTPTDL